MDEPALAIALPQPLGQPLRELALVGADGGGLPFLAVAVIDRDEGGLAAHREAHVALPEKGIDLFAQEVDPRPLLVRVRFGDPGRLVDPGHRHFEPELDLAFVHPSGDGRRTRRLGRAGERNMAFAGQKSRGRVEAHPASPGQVDLSPCMQVGEVVRGARGAVERLHVGSKLNQVARHKPGGEAEVTKHLDHQPG